MTGAHILWTQLAADGGSTLSADQIHLLDRYLDLLLNANLTMNLTGLRDRPAAEILHVGDALTLLPFLPPGPITLADVGSGGGCPGIPLAVARSDAQVLCIEATAKKAAFLNQAAAELNLSNLSVISARAEDVGRGPMRQTFDVAVARAVGHLNWVAEFCLPLVKTGGKVLAMKGKKGAGELAQAAGILGKLGGGKPAIRPAPLPGGQDHVVVEIIKVHPTEPRFPRPPTQAKGKPLS